MDDMIVSWSCFNRIRSPLELERGGGVQLLSVCRGGHVCGFAGLSVNGSFVDTSREIMK